MEPSDFQKILSEYTLSDHTKLDLKKSSFKKIGKLLESMSAQKGQGYIDYTENKQVKHKMITKVYKAKQVDYAPLFRLKRQKNKGGGNAEESKVPAGDGPNYPKIQLDEVYQLGKNIEKLNQAMSKPKK